VYRGKTQERGIINKLGKRPPPELSLDGGGVFKRRRKKKEKGEIKQHPIGSPLPRLRNQDKYETPRNNDATGRK